MTAVAASRAFTVEPHPIHRRLQRVTLDPARVRSFLSTIEHVDVQQLTYVPYMRFVVADALDRAFGKTLLPALQGVVRDRESGGFTTAVDAALDAAAFIKFGTAISHLLGPANFDSMSGTYYARFTVAHTDDSDSYLRKAYRTMMLHTDGTYVAEATDYLFLMKFAERYAAGGESRILHLDDWDELAEFIADPAAHVPMPYVGSASKNVASSVTHPTFFQTPAGWCISFIDQFAQPHNIAEGTFLDRMLASMEASPGTHALPIPVGGAIVLNNAFWLHGRAAFERNEALHRELMRIRGSFAEQ